MAMLQHANSRRMYSWWWDSHISPKNSRWLQENLTDMDKNVKAMIKLIEEDADSFRKRAEMYYRKRPELMKLVEEFYRAYRALAERYDHATGALRQAHRTMAEAFPDQIPFLLPDESLSGSSGIDSEPRTSEMLPQNDADASKGLRQMNAIFATGEEASPAVFTEASQLSEENQRLKNQIKSESERADKAQADVDRLKGTISELESDKETVFVQCQLSQEQISGLEAELSRAQEELKKLNDEMLSSISSLKSVEEQCHLLEEGNQRLKNQITSESERADKAQADVESLKGTISELESVKEAAFLQCQLSQERISSLEDELSRTQQDMKKLNDEMLTNITNLKSVEEQCHLLEVQNNSLQLELHICKETAKAKQAELDTRQEEVEKLEVSIADEKQRSVQLEMARLALEDLQSQSQKEVRLLTLEVQNGAEMLKNTELTKAALEEELQLLKEENAGVEKEKLYFSLKITDLQGEINSMNEAKRRLEDEVQHHVEENGSLKEENISSSLKIMNLQDEIAFLKESKKRLEDDVQILVEEKKALQLEIISMKEDKALLELRHRELTEKIGAVHLNIESLQVLVKELRDGNLELKEMCKMHEDEKSVHLDNLKRMEKIAEKNDVLEASLSNANVELGELREKKKALEQCCKNLQDKISMHISDKAIMVSQMETIAQNMEMLSEKNTLLENSLSDANVELEGMRGKLGSLKETCQSLQDNEFNLLSEKSTLVTQVESISRSLENSENTYAELECKNMNLEKEKEHMLHQVTELQASLKMEKEEHETLLQSNKSQLATLEHQICILQEKGCLREEALEAEHDKLINAHLENFILQRCLHDMTEKSLILSDIYEKNLQASRCKENVILELEKVSFKQNKSLSALSQDNEKLLEGVNRVMEMLNITNNETPSYQHFELILNEIKDLQALISDAQDDKQHLMVEKSIILAFLEQSKLDMMTLELEKDGVEREFIVKCEEKDNEIVFLRQANGTVCGDLDQLHNEVRDLKNREKHLISELQKRIDGAKCCEAELTTLLNESQITTINASVYEEKMLELLLTCESLEISTMVQKEKFYEEITLRNVFEDELNKKLEALIGENRGLKEELDLYMPLVLSLHNDVASLEECIISPTIRHSLEKQDNKLMCLQHESNDGERNADYRIMSAGILELQKLHAKFNALQTVLMGHLEQERSVSDAANLHVAMRKFDELNSGTIIGQEKSEVNKDSVVNSKTKEEFGADTEKSRESYDQIVKDIQLDHVLSSAQYKDGASSRAPSTIESVETKYEIELWDTGDSNKPVGSFHDLEYHQIELAEETKNEYPSSKSDPEWSRSVSGRLSFDGQRLLILQTNVKELKRRMETSLLNESRNVEFEKIKAQLKEGEKAISHLMNKNNKLIKKAEGFSASPDTLASEHNDGFGNISGRQSESKISQRARRGSEKIARLELEVQKIQYIMLKLKEEEDFRRARIGEKKTRVLLKDYLYGRKDSPKRKKVHCCACSRPKTND